ncbi:NACHT domain-containing protein [Nocardiopsis dassonvillei]|uniref:NACHT domain-containing protein n=1 Tax=Nocardiopsis dassonvillei TaxID=2014 RepID=UPI00366C8864
MPPIDHEENGFDFEARALHAARSIHDPLGLQGAAMHNGSERDAIFISDDSIHAYEFTTRRDKAKAEHDSRKLRELLNYLHAKPENAYKSVTGWFVTREEPTADQREVVKKQSKEAGFQIHAISMAVLNMRLCDSEAYIGCRDSAPFGSVSKESSGSSKVNVDPIFTLGSSESMGTGNIKDMLLEGHQCLILGDFGVGKSHALKEIYRELRKFHFKKKKLSPFPIHINLRDCAGLKTPAEVLRRHSEEIGFANDRALTSAWRAGSCILLLDGFDEIIPTQWMGSAGDFKRVRWQALSAVRRLVREAPDGTGIAVCGRSNFFSSPTEVIDVLGLNNEAKIATINDFTEDQLSDYLVKSEVSWHVPDWVPTRPLLVGYLVSQGVAIEGSDFSIDQATAWRKFFDSICQREAEMFTAVRPDIVKMIVSRVATLARSKGYETGPVDMTILRQAFKDINGRDADDEGIQLLLRLPGLANLPAQDKSSHEEQRIFADKDLADTAYGEDLARYLNHPYNGHALSKDASWVVSASDLAIRVAALSSESLGLKAGAVIAAAQKRQDGHQFDAVLADTLRVASHLSIDQMRTSFMIEGVMIDTLSLSGSDIVFDRIYFKDSIIHNLDISSLDSTSGCPEFRECIIGYLDGASSIPNWLSPKFIESTVEEFSSSSQTTSGIMSLELSTDTKIALTILKKIYSQRGSGRKESSLSRGLDPAIRGRVPDVISALHAKGWMQRTSSGKENVYVPIKSRRGEALKALENPNTFRFLV